MSTSTKAPLVGVYPQGRDSETVYIDGIRRDPAAITGPLAEVVDLGSEVVVEPLAWGVVEAEPGVFTWDQQDWWEAAARSLPRPPVRTYSLWITHMWRRGLLPPDLVDEPFDSPLFLKRFEAFVAAAAERCGWTSGTPVVLLSNELDSFTDRFPEQTESLLNFLPQGADIVRRHASAALVTNTVTHTVLGKPRGRELAMRAHERCDLFGFNWYDISADFPVHMPPRTPAETMLASMADCAQGRPLFLQETGLPASPGLGSSPEAQAAFVDELFDAVDRRNANELWGCLWFELHDFTDAVVVGWLGAELPELLAEKEFVSFLTSLGVRDASGRPRPALERLRARLHAHRARSEAQPANANGGLPRVPGRTL